MTLKRRLAHCLRRYRLVRFAALCVSKLIAPHQVVGGIGVIYVSHGGQVCRFHGGVRTTA